MECCSIFPVALKILMHDATGSSWACEGMFPAIIFPARVFVFHPAILGHSGSILEVVWQHHGVSEQLGHASAAFTLDTYSHVLPHMQDEAAAKMEAALLNGLSL